MKKTLLATCVFTGLVMGIFAYALWSQPKPEYGWLFFGPDASIRVLVTLYGETVTLDHYFDGKPTGRHERFDHRLECKDVSIADPDGKTTYIITSMSGSVVREQVATEFFANVSIQGPVNYEQYCDLTMTADAERASIAHFHGPLVIYAQTSPGKSTPELALKRGEKPTELRVYVGTVDADKGCWVVVRTQDDESNPVFPIAVHPFADIEFPPLHAGVPPVRQRYSLDKLC